MKSLKKYVYMSPETEILSLEAKTVILAGSPGGDDIFNPIDDEGGPKIITGGGAPWRY